MQRSPVVKKLLLAAGASMALAGTSAHALDIPCPVGTNFSECFIGAVSGKKTTFSDWTIGDLTVNTLSNIVGSFSQLGLKLTSVSLSDGEHVYSHINLSKGISFSNVSAGEYDVRISGQLTGPKMFDHHYGMFFGGFQVTPVPEPETYALLLAGLLAIGYVARRRSQS